MIVHTTPVADRWCRAVHAPQLHLDFLLSSGERIGYADIIAMPGMAFVLYVQVVTAHRGKGHGRAIHRELIRRYGAVACETFCTEEEASCLRSMRLRGEVTIAKEPGPTVAGRPAICRHRHPVERMFVARAVP